MVQRSRGRGDVIPHSADLLKVLGDCRKRVIDAHTEVRPFGAAYHALSMVTTAIDALATFMTGIETISRLAVQSRRREAGT